MCSALVDEKLGENQTNQDRQVSKAGNPTVRDLAEAILSNQAKLDRYAVAIGLYSPSGNEIGALKLNIEELGVLYKASEGKSLSNDDKALFNSAVQKTVELVEKIGRNYLGNQSTETKDGAKLDLNEARDLYSKEVKKTIDNILSKIPPDLDPVTKQRLIGLAVASEAKPQYIFRNETVTPTVQVSGQEVMLKSVFFTEGQKTFYDNYKDTATTVTIKIVSLQGTILRLSQLYKAWQEANISGNNEQKARVIESLRSEATLSITDEQLKNANTNPKIIEDNINQRLLELKAELDSEMDKAVKLDKYAKQVLQIDRFKFDYERLHWEEAQRLKARNDVNYRYDVRSLTHEGANEARYYWKKGLVQLAQASEIAKVAEKSLGFVKTLAGFSVQVSNDGETPTVVCNLNEHYKKNRFPREAKILDPLIARAYLEFLERGLWDSSKDKEIASKWGVPQSEVEYARRHLYGSIDEAWFRKHNFTGLGNLPQDPEQAKKIVEKLCKDTERLLRDRKDRLNPTLVTGLNILFSTAGTLIVNPGLTAIKALESAAVGAGAAYVAKQAGIPKEVAQAVSILAGAQVIKGNAKRTSSGPNLPPGEQ